MADKLSALLVESAVEFGHEMSTLKHSHIDWQVVKNADAALAMLESRVFDLVLINFELCENSASEICKKIRSRQGELYTSIVYLSSESQLERRLKAYEAGADDFVVKSTLLKELQHKLHVCIQYQNHRRTLTENYESRHCELMRNNFDAEEDTATLLSVYKNCLTVNSIEQLASVLQAKLGTFQLSYSLQITTGLTIFRIKDDGSDFSPMELDLFMSLRGNSSKIQSFGHKSYFQHHDVELVIHNMPIDDAETYGRLKDLIHLIISVINDKNKILNVLLLARSKCKDMLASIDVEKMTETSVNLLALQEILKVPVIEDMNQFDDDFIYF